VFALTGAVGNFGAPLGAEVAGIEMFGMRGILGKTTAGVPDGGEGALTAGESGTSSGITGRLGASPGVLGRVMFESSSAAGESAGRVGAEAFIDGIARPLGVVIGGAGTVVFVDGVTTEDEITEGGTTAAGTVVSRAGAATGRVGTATGREGAVALREGIAGSATLWLSVTAESILGEVAP